jgi:hypothetical protein
VLSSALTSNGQARSIESYGAVVTTGYALGLLDLYDMSSTHGFGIRVNFNSFDSLITRARNTMVAEFLADDRFTHLMWIDSDIGFKGEDVVRLLRADRPVAAGVYPLKNDGWPATGLAHAMPAGATKADFRALRADRFHADPPRGVCRADRALSGIAVPLAGRRELDEGKTADFLYAFFDTGIDPQTWVYLSEDYWFCHLVESIGITPVIDTHSNLSHQGIATYEGDLSRSLELQRSMTHAVAQ